MKLVVLGRGKKRSIIMGFPILVVLSIISNRVIVMSDDDKAIVVLTQEEIDIAIHGLEEAGIGYDEEEFREAYGDVYEKLMAIERNPGDSFRVK